MAVLLSELLVKLKIMEVLAKSTNLRISPRKVRLVADQVRSLPVGEAEIILGTLNKRASRPLLLVLRQGIANAENNFGLKKDSLKIKRLEVGKGATMKRYRFVARGRIHRILKRTSHISLILEGEKGKVASRPDKEDSIKKKGEKNGSKS